MVRRHLDGDYGELLEELKCAHAQKHVPYDGQTCHAALDAVWAEAHRRPVERRPVLVRVPTPPPPHPPPTPPPPPPMGQAEARHLWAEVLARCGSIGGVQIAGFQGMLRAPADGSGARFDYASGTVTRAELPTWKNYDAAISGKPRKDP